MDRATTTPKTAELARSGPIAFMASHPIAANLLMVFLLFAGVFAAGELVQEMLPDASLDLVQVVVPYPGAAPEEVESAIVRKIEEEIGSLDGVTRIEASASEGLGSVIAEFKTGTDISRALNDVKARVDRIPSFPAGAERPEVREITSRQSVIRLVVHGDVPERALKEVAHRIEDGISSLPEVSYVETSGVREYEISIEVPSHRLRALGLTLEDIALAVRRGSAELSAGKISTGEEEIRVRTIGQNYDQYDFEEIIVLSRPDGTSLRLGDIAELRDGFADTDLITRFNGNRAVRVDVTRTADEQVLEIAEAVRAYLAAEVVPNLPEGVGVEIWRDDTTLVGSRLSLLIENGILGLILVFLGLALFLEIRLAVWVGAGLVVSLIGTLWVMQILGVSINMFSMLALVLALGIVVDDAIVVGENIFAERKKGRDGLTTAIRGARRISGPVIFSVLTTVTAFCALLAVPGPSGKLMRSVPIVVIAILAISLVESLLILPRHLSHLPPPGTRAATAIGRWLSRVQGAVDRGLKRLVNGPLDRGLRLATDNPPIVLAASTGAIVLAMALVGSGFVRVEVPPAGRGRCHRRELRAAHRDARRAERGSGCATRGGGTSCRGPVVARTAGRRRSTPVERQRHRGGAGRTVQSPAGRPDDASTRPYRSCPVRAAGGGGLHRQRIRAGVAGRGGNAAGSEVSRVLVGRARAGTSRPHGTVSPRSRHTEPYRGRVRGGVGEHRRGLRYPQQSG